jgi:hypothetical protein
MARTVRDADALECLRHAGTPLAGRHVAIQECHLDVFLHGQVVDQIETLEDETDGRASHAGELRLGVRRHAFAEELVGPAGWRVEQAEDVQQRGFAAARRPHDRDELAGSNFQAHVVERVGFNFAGAIHLADMIEFQHPDPLIECRYGRHCRRSCSQK